MRARILIVDDEPDILASLTAFIAKHMQAEVVGAVDGESARARLEAEDFDLVITDHRMPGMTGIQLASWIRERGGPPTVMCTAYPDLDLAIDACNRGRVDAFFTKPFDPTELLEAAQFALHRRLRGTALDRAYARATALAGQAQAPTGAT